jgi:hypothetical protein
VGWLIVPGDVPMDSVEDILNAVRAPHIGLVERWAAFSFALKCFNTLSIFLQRSSAKTNTSSSHFLSGDESALPAHGRELRL